jgi:hypothetical protein
MTLTSRLKYDHKIKKIIIYVNVMLIYVNNIQFSSIISLNTISNPQLYVSREKCLHHVIDIFREKWLHHLIDVSRENSTIIDDKRVLNRKNIGTV